MRVAKEKKKRRYRASSYSDEGVTRPSQLVKLRLYTRYFKKDFNSDTKYRMIAET